MKYCPDCGNNKERAARFCHQCGFAFPGASNHIVALGLCVVVFLSGLSYAAIQRVFLPNFGEEPKPVTEAAVNHDHDDHSDHDHPEETQTAATSNSGNRAKPAHSPGAGGTAFAQVETFFRSNGIMGPKVFSFKVVDDSNAIVYLDGFPIDQMPEAMRTNLDNQIKAQLEPLGAGVSLELRDARDRRLLAGYKNE